MQYPTLADGEYSVDVVAVNVTKGRASLMLRVTSNVLRNSIIYLMPASACIVVANTSNLKNSN